MCSPQKNVLQHLSPINSLIQSVCSLLFTLTPHAAFDVVVDYNAQFLNLFCLNSPVICCKFYCFKGLKTKALNTLGRQIYFLNAPVFNSLIARNFFLSRPINRGNCCIICSNLSGSKSAMVFIVCSSTSRHV